MDWVAKKGRREWNSSRTRDAIDLAFTLKESKSGKAIIEARTTWDENLTHASEQRARYIIGRFQFANIHLAKDIVEKLVKVSNVLPLPDRKDNREIFFKAMLDCSEEDVVYENISYKAHAGTISGKTMFKEGITKMSPTLASMLTEAVADMVAPVFEAAPVPSKPVEVDISQFKLGDPAPEGYIWLGKKLTRIGWPS